MRVPLQEGVRYRCGLCRAEIPLVADGQLRSCPCRGAAVDVCREGVRLVGDVIHVYPNGLEVRPAEAENAAHETPT